MKKISVSIVLDKRRQKQDGTYPVKLRLYCPHPRKQKLYPTIFDFTSQEFASIWETTKPREIYKEKRRKLIALEQLAKDKIDALKKFSFDAFETAFFGADANTDYSKVSELFKEVVSQKEKIGAISTAEKYSLAYVCLHNYVKQSEDYSDELLIEQVDVKFLVAFKTYCQDTKKLSPATIGIYIRNLRSIYRLAIEKGVISAEDYPFGKNKFSIPSSGKINKSLTEEELRQLWFSVPQNEKQARAKDFWFFSYYTYGMNTKDICELTHQSIKGNSLHYVRAKTKNTKKETTIKEVPITSTILDIIERRKVMESKYLFGVINDNDDPKKTHLKIKRFNAFTNKYFREFAISSGMSPDFVKDIGTYHTRHSFATIAIRKGKSTALISEILHDGNLKVTESYINSFPKAVFKELSDEMEF